MLRRRCRTRWWHLVLPGHYDSRRPRHRNVIRHSIRPPMHQATSTSATRACSHAPAISSPTAASGRNTERKPCAIHFNGNSEPTWTRRPGQLRDRHNEDA